MSFSLSSLPLLIASSYVVVAECNSVLLFNSFYTVISFYISIFYMPILPREGY